MAVSFNGEIRAQMEQTDAFRVFCESSFFFFLKSDSKLVSKLADFLKWIRFALALLPPAVHGAVDFVHIVGCRSIKVLLRGLEPVLSRPSDNSRASPSVSVVCFLLSPVLFSAILTFRPMSFPLFLHLIHHSLASAVCSFCSPLLATCSHDCRWYLHASACFQSALC